MHLSRENALKSGLRAKKSRFLSGQLAVSNTKETAIQKKLNFRSSGRMTSKIVRVAVVSSPAQNLRKHAMNPEEQKSILGKAAGKTFRKAGSATTGMAFPY